MHEVPTITPQALKAELEGPNPPKLLDVREDDEREISVLNDHAHIPLDDLQDRFRELDASANWVVYCRTGKRSHNAAAYLKHRGFTQVRNLETGINGWAETIDPSMTTY